MDEKTKRESDQAGARWVEIAWDRMEWVPTRRRNNLIYRRTHDYTPLSPPPLSLKRSDKSCQYQARINKSCRFLLSPFLLYLSLSFVKFVNRSNPIVHYPSIHRATEEKRKSFITICNCDIENRYRRVD